MVCGREFMEQGKSEDQGIPVMACVGVVVFGSNQPGGSSLKSGDHLVSVPIVHNNRTIMSHRGLSTNRRTAGCQDRKEANFTNLTKIPEILSVRGGTYKVDRFFPLVPTGYLSRHAIMAF